MSSPTFRVSIPPSASNLTESPVASRFQQKKRNQVARACDWCRVHRIKCDSVHPCSNCRKRGGQCSNDRTAKSATLPQAYREIEQLKHRVQELELELAEERKRDQTLQQLHTPSSAHDHEGSEHATSASEVGRAKKFWEGIHLSTARSPNKTWYGPASLFYFIGCINTFLTAALKQTHSARHMMPNSASTVLNGPAPVAGNNNVDRSGRTAADPVRAGESLTPTQEEYFLNLFWQSYYPSYPILDELEFKAHYQSLWVTSEKERKPSALVDIVLAVCMQYGMARLPGGKHDRSTPSRSIVNDSDSSIAGRWHYRRCLTLLSEEMESPTISTLQCHLLCALYLCYGSFQNMADNACGLAAQTAYMLGLHLEPPYSMPRRERELRKRLWWAVYVLESKRSMKLGRPFSTHESTGSCSLPADDREIAMMASPSFAPIGENVTWLSWHLHNTMLTLATRKAYTSLYDRAPDPLTACDITPIARSMEKWRKAVPVALQTQRQGGGAPLSTDLSPLEIEPFTPLWLQRQRLILEVAYHNTCTNLYRPSICFALAGVPVSVTEHAASTCVAHGMAATHIMHQVLTSTSILEGWHEAFQWQWNTAMTLVGYVLAYPNGNATSAARKAIDLSVAVFEIFGNSFAVAASAATIMGELAAKVDRLVQESVQRQDASNLIGPLERFQTHSDEQNPSYQAILSDSSIPLDIVDWPLNFDDTTTEIGGVLGQTIDISAETLTDFEWTEANNSFLDQWVFMQQDL